MSDTLLTPYGLPNETVLRNLSPAALYEEAIRYDKGASIADSGALIAYSGDKTGRSPKDKRIVRDAGTEALATRPRLYVVDAFAGWDPEHRIKVRVVCERPYHALFMWTMLIRPTEQESAEFGVPDWTIFNAGAFPANPLTSGMTSRTSVDVDLAKQQIVILGTEYAGEMTRRPVAAACFLGCRAPARRP